MAERSRGRVTIRSAGDLPAVLIDEVIVEMADRMSGTPEARRCAGLSFTFIVTEHTVAPARYGVSRGGRVRLTRNGSAPASFHFKGPADIFDSVLRAHQSALWALLRGRIHMRGSLPHIRQLLRMMPSVERAYAESRRGLIERHASDYEIRF
jgi:hypothetical protein